MVIKKFIYQDVGLLNEIEDTYKEKENVGDQIKDKENQLSSDIENNVNLEAIQKEHYNNGYNAGYQEGIDFENKASKEKFDLLSQEKADTQKFIELLEDNIKKLDYNSEQDRQEIQEYLSNVTSILAKKLCLTIPVNLQELLNSYLLPTIKNAYNSSVIVINVNTTMLSFCKEILDESNLSFEIKDKIKIEAKEDIDHSDCNITMDNTKIMYNQELLVNQINQLLLNNLKNNV